MSDDARRDPVAYRIDYSLAAQHLHAATEMRDREAGRAEDREIEPPQIILETLERVKRQLLPRQEELVPSIERAQYLALELIQASSTELLRQGWRWPGRRPPWYVRKRHRRNDRRLAEFLDQVLEPARVVLYWSCRAQRGEQPIWEEAEPTQPDRRKLATRTEIDPRCLVDYLAELLDPDLSPPRGWRRLAAWLGFARLRTRATPDPRVRYNLACLFSRLAGRRYVEANERPDDRLRRSARQLRLALEGMAGSQRDALARWADQDPGLRNLRRSSSDFGQGLFG